MNTTKKEKGMPKPKPRPTRVTLAVTPASGPQGTSFTFTWTNAPKGSIMELSDGQRTPPIVGAGSASFVVSEPGGNSARVITYVGFSYTIHAEVLFVVQGGPEV